MTRLTRLFSATAALLALAFSAACTSPDATSEPAALPEDISPLAGTAWQLVRIMSMDDQVFTPDEPDRYTLQFEPDGGLKLRADCNRGQGRWTLTDPSGLRLEALATTRAMCSPESLHDRYLSDLGYVRSFIMDSGHLFLATLADGAILEFEPITP